MEKFPQFFLSLLFTLTFVLCIWNVHAAADKVTLSTTTTTTTNTQLQFTASFLDKVKSRSADAQSLAMIQMVQRRLHEMEHQPSSSAITPGDKGYIQMSLYQDNDCNDEGLFAKINIAAACEAQCVENELIISECSSNSGDTCDGCQETDAIETDTCIASSTLSDGELPSDVHVKVQCSSSVDLSMPSQVALTNEMYFGEDCQRELLIGGIAVSTGCLEAFDFNGFQPNSDSFSDSEASMNVKCPTAEELETGMNATISYCTQGQCEGECDVEEFPTGECVGELFISMKTECIFSSGSGSLSFYGTLVSFALMISAFVVVIDIL